MEKENTPAGGGISHNDMYITRLPSPPVIRVCPVSWQQKFSFVDAVDLSRDVPDFLREIDWTPFEHPPAADEWNYEHRRRAQAILPFLAVGPLSVVKDYQYLRDEGISAILAIRHKHSSSSTNSTPAYLTQAQASLGVDVHTFEVSDPQGLVAIFPEAIKFINSHLSGQRSRSLLHGLEYNKPGKVLVVCESGNQRAPAVVAAYLMDVLHQDFITAIQYVNCRRFCTDLNEPLKRILQAYQDVIKAKRDVMGAISGTPNPTFGTEVEVRPTFKRTWEQSSEDGENAEVDSHDIDGTFNSDGRFFAPFGD